MFGRSKLIDNVGNCDSKLQLFGEKVKDCDTIARGRDKAKANLKTIFDYK